MTSLPRFLRPLRFGASSLGAGLLFATAVSLAGAAPTVSLIFPKDNAVYLANVRGWANAQVTPSSGTKITKVAVYRGTTLIATNTTPASEGHLYSIVWNSLPVGTYNLTIKATDDKGATTTSSARKITVATENTAPTVTLTSPADATNIPLGNSVILRATVSTPEANDRIASLKFFQGSTLIGTQSDTGYVSWTPREVGVYNLKAVVTDSAGATTTSAVNTLIVKAPNTLPTVSLAAPMSNSVFTAPANIALTAEATDSDGMIAKVEFYGGEDLIGSATSSPYSVTWNNVAIGSYLLTARATDNTGATISSAQVPVQVVAASGARLYYLHTDHLDTPRLVTDESNKVVWRNSPLAEPFGNTPPEEDPDGDGTAFTLNLRFPGQVFDKETNTHYNYFRDYNPQTGRYIQSDPIGLAGGINTYGYVGGSPMSRVDPDGLAYFAFRPLQVLSPVMFLAPFLGTRQIGHEEVFFEDGGAPSSLGYGPSGVGPDPFPFGYVKADGGYNDCIMRKAVAMNLWSGSGYSMVCTNCQKWSSAVRATYNELAKNPKVIQECGGGCSEQPATRSVPFFAGRPKPSDDPVSQASGNSPTRPQSGGGVTPPPWIWGLGL